LRKVAQGLSAVRFFNMPKIGTYWRSTKRRSEEPLCYSGRRNVNGLPV
jgi:hypothetical protein